MATINDNHDDQKDYENTQTSQGDNQKTGRI